MAEYLVTWKIELEAKTPQKAAEEARRIQLDPDSIATIFEVVDTAKMFEIDVEDVFGDV